MYVQLVTNMNGNVQTDTSTPMNETIEGFLGTTKNATDHIM